MDNIYEKIKHYYDTGLWSKQRMRNIVEKGIITPEKYRMITGENYEE